MSDLVRNPNCWFSHAKAHFKYSNQVGIMAYGKLVYFGGAEQMLEYFDKLGYPCPTYSNPTDHYGRIFVSFWYCLKIYNIFVLTHFICLNYI